MAKGRMIPTQLFTTPEFVDLVAEHGALATHVLLGICLDADDYGRGYAHLRTLAAKLHCTSEHIVPILDALEQYHFIQRYSDEQTKQTYYFVSHWFEWQWLSKPTPSHFPVPPGQENAIPQKRTNKNTQGNPGEARPEVEDEDERESEKEAITTTSNITDDDGRHLPNSNSSNTLLPVIQKISDEALVHLTDQVACALKISPTPKLLELVRCFSHYPDLVLEAHAARERVDDPERDKSKPGMSLGYFKYWMQRKWDTPRQAPQSKQVSSNSRSSGMTQSWRSSFDDPNYQDNSFYPTQQEKKEQSHGENW